MFVRPGLKEFLEAVGEFADVVLFTAGLAGYAAPMLAALDPASTRLPVRLFRPSTVTVGGTACVKDLAVLGRDLGRTVLVDNSPFSFLAQPYCGLPAAPFDGCGHDSHLLDTVLPLLRQLAAGGDVRPALAARFGMAAWLSARGGWALYEAPCGNLSVAAGGGVVTAAA
jgi:RNA polymerase II subunit A small phosphatase-like protein